MPLSCSIENPDSLETILSKAKAIQAVNKENLAFIESRKGQQVITQHRYSLEIKPTTEKKQKTCHQSGEIIYDGVDDQHLTLRDNSSKTDIDYIIASWEYCGDVLKKEKNTFDYFIDLRLKRYYDLDRLNREYERLLEKYSRLLVDEEESRVAVEVVLRNLEVLQVAIGDIHGQVMDVVDPKPINEATASFIKYVSDGLKKLQSKLPGFQLDFQGKLLENDQEEDIVVFDNLGTLKCKDTLSGQRGEALALEAYSINDKQHLASAGFDGTIRLWDLGNGELSDILTGHGYAVYTLVTYQHKSIPMLASGSWDKTIKLWDLSNNSCVQTILGHTWHISSMAISSKGDKPILISGDMVSKIKLWNLDDCKEIVTLKGHTDTVTALCVYHHGSKSYFVSGGSDKIIKVWDLYSHFLVETLFHGKNNVESLAVANRKDQKLLFSGGRKGRIKVWNLSNYECIISYKTHELPIHTLQAVECDGKVFLFRPDSHTMINLDDPTKGKTISSFSTPSNSLTMKAFGNGEEPCLVIGHVNGSISLWMQERNSLIRL